MVYLDFHSLSLIGALRRVGQGPGRRLFPYSLRFPLTMPHNCHAARGLGGRPALGPDSLRFRLTEPHRRHPARGPGGMPALGSIQQ